MFNNTSQRLSPTPATTCRVKPRQAGLKPKGSWVLSIWPMHPLFPAVAAAYRDFYSWSPRENGNRVPPQIFRCNPCLIRGHSNQSSSPRRISFDYLPIHSFPGNFHDHFVGNSSQVSRMVSPAVKTLKAGALSLLWGGLTGNNFILRIIALHAASRQSKERDSVVSGRRGGRYGSHCGI